MKPPNMPKTYPGLEHDINGINGGMTVYGKIIRDAWVFGILPETQTCKDWDFSRIDGINQLVNDEWDKYGCMVSQLPDELRERHKRIYDEAIATARSKGWDPDAAVRSES